MSNFGKYAVVDPITYHFEKEPTWWWKINPPTSGDELVMSKFMVNARVEVDAQGNRREYPPTNIEVAHREIALTFGGTNIPKDDDKPVEDGGEPIMKPSDTLDYKEAMLRRMPQKMIWEIWSAIGVAIPGWGASLPKVKEED